MFWNTYDRGSCHFRNGTMYHVPVRVSTAGRSAEQEHPLLPVEASWQVQTPMEDSLSLSGLFPWAKKTWQDILDSLLGHRLSLTTITTNKKTQDVKFKLIWVKCHISVANCGETYSCIDRPTPMNLIRYGTGVYNEPLAQSKKPREIHLLLAKHMTIYIYWLNMTNGSTLLTLSPNLWRVHQPSGSATVQPCQSEVMATPHTRQCPLSKNKVHSVCSSLIEGI